MELAEATDRLLVAAERLYYRNGIAAVGIDEVRAAAGVSMRRLYQLYPSKEHLVAAYLDARDVRWRGRVTAHVDAAGDDPGARLLAVFDWLGLWFAEDDFRGCAFINAFGEIGGDSPLILAAVQRHRTSSATTCSTSPARSPPSRPSRWPRASRCSPRAR